jgi:hypothetical protein
MTTFLGDELIYKNKICYKLSDVENAYLLLIKEFSILFYEKNKICGLKNFEFIFERGVKTINHVFLFLLMYVKNMPVVLSECKKSYFYYIEFIEQITDKEYNYLNLTSQEAILFVYKKSIYEISNIYRKKNMKLSVCDEEFIDKLNKLMNNINNNTIINFVSSISNNVSIEDFKKY